MPLQLLSDSAFDFAVTAPQRQDVITDAANETLTAAIQYDARKRTYMNTEKICFAAGVVLNPMVAEITGAWSPNATRALKSLSKALALRTGGRHCKENAGLLQASGVGIRRESARAILRRCQPA